MAKLTLSQGASWLVERLPDAVFEQLKEDIETLIDHELKLRGYDEALKQSFSETEPATLERKP